MRNQVPFHLSAVGPEPRAVPRLPLLPERLCSNAHHCDQAGRHPVRTAGTRALSHTEAQGRAYAERRKERATLHGMGTREPQRAHLDHLRPRAHHCDHAGGHPVCTAGARAENPGGFSQSWELKGHPWSFVAAMPTTVITLADSRYTLGGPGTTSRT